VTGRFSEKMLENLLLQHSVIIQQWDQDCLEIYYRYGKEAEQVVTKLSVDQQSHHLLHIHGHII
jgi:hypothetical protein